MLLLLALFIINTVESDVPHWAIIRIEPSNSDDYSCKMEEELYEKYKDQCKNYPKEFSGQDACDRVMKPYAGLKCYKGDDENAVNEALKKVDKSIELLIVQNCVLNQKIDFNNLPSQMMVILHFQYTETSSVEMIQDLMIKNKFEANTKSFERIVKELPKRATKEGIADVKIVGNIKEKVTAFIPTCNFQIVDSDLNCDNLILATADFDEEFSPNKIKTQYAISEISHGFRKSDKVAPTQIGFYETTEKLRNYSITFEPQIVNVGVTEDKSHNQYYTADDLFSLIIYANEITFKYTEDFGQLENNGFKLNITLMNYALEKYPSDSLESGSWSGNSQLLEKETIKIKKEGDWSILKQKPEITFTYDKNLYELDTKEMDEIATIKTSDAYEFKTKWSESKKKNVGLIVGVTIACVVVVAVIVVVVVLVLRNKHKKISDG